jgi:hypothetical protein
MDALAWIIGIVGAWAMVSLWRTLRHGRGLSFSDWWTGGRGPERLGHPENDHGLYWKQLGRWLRRRF